MTLAIAGAAFDSILFENNALDDVTLSKWCATFLKQTHKDPFSFISQLNLSMHNAEKIFKNLAVLTPQGF